MAKFEMKDFVGVIPAMMTIFDKNEEIDEKATRDFVNYLIKKGVDGLYLTGSTGEGFLMTGEERKKVVEIVISEVDGRIPVMVHVGDIGTKKSIELAKHAYETGADAISSVPPFYWKFKEDNMFQYYKDISESTPLPMVVYNVPLVGALGIDFVKRLATIDNVKGVKYTLPTHFEIVQMKEQIGEDFIIYSGCDEMAVSGLMNGADGIIGSFYNIIPELFKDIYNAVRNNDMETARTKQDAAVHIIMYSVKYDFISIMRHVLRMLGVEGGYSRRPFSNLSDSEFEAVKSDLKEIKTKHNIEGVDFLDLL